MNVKLEHDGKVVVEGDVPTKDFKTGSKGWYRQDRVDLKGKRCLVTVSVIEIGSKKS